MLKFVDHLLYKFLKWSLILLGSEPSYYRLEINPLPEEDEAMRPAAPPPLPQPARPPPTPSDLERMRRNEAELQAALDEARFHSRRPPAARPARSEPAEPPAYERHVGRAPVLRTTRRPVEQATPSTTCSPSTSTDVTWRTTPGSMIHKHDVRGARNNSMGPGRWSHCWLLCARETGMYSSVSESHQGSIQAEPCAKVTFWTD